MLLACVTCFTTSSYAIMWLCVVAIPGVALRLAVLRSVRSLWLIIAFYFGIGLLNISSWRGYIETETVRNYFVALLCLAIPFLVMSKNWGHQPSLIVVGRVKSKTIETFRAAAVLHIGLTYAVVAFVYGTIGVVGVNPELRFQVPVPIEYIAKSALPLAAFAVLASPKRPWLFVLIVIAPALLLSYRGVAVAAVLAHVLVSMDMDHIGLTKASTRRDRGRWRQYLILGLLTFAILAIGFYMRRTSGSLLAPAAFIVSHYFDVDGVWLYALLPLYLGLKETTGLTNSIIVNDTINGASEHPLFLADLWTILPGENLGAGTSLARLMGTVGEGGLTPGILGGIYIDYGLLYPLFFLGFGVGLAWFANKASGRPLLLPVQAVILTQFLHLIHRGFVKPEYISTIAIAYLYFLLLRGFRMQ